MSALFRTEVIERQSNRLHGDILVLPRFSHSLILGLLLLWAVGVGSWLTLSTYARKETVLGWLDPSEGLTRIYAADGGLIQKVLVAEGDQVQAGQPLIIIDNAHYLVDGDDPADRLDMEPENSGWGDMESRLLTEYRAQQQLLQEQQDSTGRLHQRRSENLAQQISAKEQDLFLLQAQLDTLDERHRLMLDQIERSTALRKARYIAQDELDQLRTQGLALRSERQGLLREQTSAKNALEQLHNQLAALPDESANELAQLQARLSDVVQQIAQLQGQRAWVIKAPRAGEINNLQARVGARVHGNSSIPLLTLIPEATELAAHLLVPVRSAGFVAPGQQLDIRYDAFPYQKFGLYQGEVLHISDTVLLPDELLNAPLGVEEPVYRVTASLRQAGIRAYGRDFSLKPGMTLSADVRLGERSLLQWLLEPLYSLRGRL